MTFSLFETEVTLLAITVNSEYSNLKNCLLRQHIEIWIATCSKQTANGITNIAWQHCKVTCKQTTSFTVIIYSNEWTLASTHCLHHNVRKCLEWYSFKNSWEQLFLLAYVMWKSHKACGKVHWKSLGFKSPKCFWLCARKFANISLCSPNELQFYCLFFFSNYTLLSCKSMVNAFVRNLCDTLLQVLNFKKLAGWDENEKRRLLFWQAVTFEVSSPKVRGASPKLNVYKE